MGGVFKYFSFQGRANRQRYWVTAITIGVFGFLAVLVLSVLSRIPVIGLLFGVLMLAAACAAIFAILANGGRRLHDRDKSAWWLLVFQAAPFLLGALSSIAEIGGGEAGKTASAGFTILGLPLSIWAFIELGCLRGTAGPNRFGADPLAPPLDEVFA